jgi:hypothetical protein
MPKQDKPNVSGGMETMILDQLTQVLRFLGLRSRQPAGGKRNTTNKPILEFLEPRLTPNVTIQLDYSYDTSGFFVGHPDRQSLLSTAANALLSRIGDSLGAIIPNAAAGDTWTAVFTNPSTDMTTQVDNLTVPANTIIIYAGGRPLGAGDVGIGGPGGFDASGDQAWLNMVQGRGKPGTLGPDNLQTAFAPWGGSVEFDTSSTNWYFGAGAAGILPTQTDFLTVAEHEIAHVLGFGTSNSWTNLVVGSTFVGPNAEAEFGGPVPTDAAGSAAQHWADGTTDRGQHCTMDPVVTDGERDTFTLLDYAGLQDLGWNLQSPQPVGPGPYTAIVGVSSSGAWWAGLSTGSGFVGQLMATWSTGGNWLDVVSGDFNGDGLLDVGGLSSTGDWWVGLNAGGSSFTWSRWAQWSTGVTWSNIQVGDFNNDGRADIVGRALQSGQWWMNQSTASSFKISLWSTWSTGATWVDVQVGDFNGDHQADIVGRALQTGQWWLGLSKGTSFATSLWAVWSTGVTWVDVHAADLNGDGQTDIVGRALQLGQWWAGLSIGSAFATQLWAAWSTGVTWTNVQVADFNNDGRADIAAMTAQSGQWWVSLSTGSGTSTSLWTRWSPTQGWTSFLVGDFTGDGKKDIAARTAGGDWWVAASTGSSFANAYWGTWSTGVTWPDIFAGRVS